MVGFVFVGSTEECTLSDIMFLDIQSAMFWVDEPTCGSVETPCWSRTCYCTIASCFYRNMGRSGLEYHCGIYCSKCSCKARYWDFGDVKSRQEMLQGLFSQGIFSNVAWDVKSRQETTWRPFDLQIWTLGLGTFLQSAAKESNCGPRTLVFPGSFSAAGPKSVGVGLAIVERALRGFLKFGVPQELDGL